MVVTSPQNAATIGWEYDGVACLDHLSECFASASTRKTIQKLVKPVDDIGDRVLDTMTPITLTLASSPSLVARLT